MKRIACNLIGLSMALSAGLVTAPVAAQYIAAGTQVPSESAPDKEQLEKRIDEALQKARASCQKRKWKKEVMDRRIGRIMARILDSGTGPFNSGFVPDFRVAAPPSMR